MVCQDHLIVYEYFHTRTLVACVVPKAANNRYRWGDAAMAHNLLHDEMAFVGNVPWHGLGRQVPPTVTASEMCRAAGLDWKVTKVPAPGARIVDATKELHDRYLVLREAIQLERDPVALGMVGLDYEPLQNTDAFAFFGPLVENKYAQFHTAGALGNGEKVWVLAKLAEQIIIKGDDIVDRFVLLSNSHNGRGAVTVRFTPIRVVCQNTLNYAMKKSSGVISVRHTRHIARNLADAQAKQLKRVIEKVFSQAGELFGQMAMRNMTAESTNAFLEVMFPRTASQRKQFREPERWTRIKTILDDPSVTPAKTKNTLWALYNAVVRDEDYRQSSESSADARLERVWFGKGHNLKVKALQASRDQLRKAA
jgi:phage/plasmid-like protein (TIGR03299 family)